ncbi:MAG: hypothetical protein A2Z16_05340 [Chloroflexi bacterium RBG_16_54_18]|nr:MAG: hypothetical protein A2Z16_05340 [Chloroflexi bacterium RBG_16_54_18]
MNKSVSPYLNLLKNRIDLSEIPFSERGSRLLFFRENQHFTIRLAERWTKLSRKLSDYRQRPSLVDQLFLEDQSGSPLPVEVTTFPDSIEVSTPIGLFEFLFQDSETICLILPPIVCGVSFHARLDNCQVDRRGGILRLTGDIRRNIAYTTNAKILKNSSASSNENSQIIHLKMDASGGNQALLLNITPRLGFNRWIPDPNLLRQDAANRWIKWFSSAPEVLDEYRDQYLYAWWIMRAGLLSTRFYTTREVMAPSKNYYVGSWQWDNFFHALAYRYVDGRLAQDQLRILIDHQREDGMIPDAIHDEGTITHLDFPVDADVTKPPLIAWAAWKLFELDQDREFLDEVYGSLVSWNSWWFEKNDLDHNGLCEYQHPFSSGLDDSPLWDAGMPVESPDLNTYLYLQMEVLARIAVEIGELDDARMWKQKSEVLLKLMIEKCWDSKAGIFNATHQGKKLDVLTPFNLFPLITGRMPASISSKLIQHLQNRDEFWTAYPIPTVAANQPQYDPQQMWRGPTWVNVNYLLIEGLFKSGYADLARALRRRTLELLMARSDFYEYYHPDSGDNPPNAAPIFGWSAALFIDMAIQATREANSESGETQ